MGQVDFVGVQTIMTHQQPSGDTCRQLHASIGQRGVGYLDGEVADVAQEVVTQAGMFRDRSPKILDRYAIPLPLNLHQRLMRGLAVAQQDHRSRHPVPTEHPHHDPEARVSGGHDRSKSGMTKYTCLIG